MCGVVSILVSQTQFGSSSTVVASGSYINFQKEFTLSSKKQQVSLHYFAAENLTKLYILFYFMAKDLRETDHFNTRVLTISRGFTMSNVDHVAPKS